MISLQFSRIACKISLVGAMVGIVKRRDDDVEVPDHYVDPRLRKDKDGKVPDDDAPKGERVGVFQVSSSGNGVLLLVNDQALVLDRGPAASLKQELDAAVMSGVY